MILNRASGLFLTVLSATGLCGCGSGATVEGTVSLNGVPLQRAEITFLPAGDTPGRALNAATDATGRYELETPPGSYKVVISKRDVFVDEEHKPGYPMDDELVELLPAHYSDRSQTELQADVPANGNAEINFLLVEQRSD